VPPKGRRDLSKSPLPVVSFDILDPELEGKAERIGWDDVQRLGFRRGGKIRVVARRAVYKLSDASTPTSTIVTAPMPKELLRRGLLAPSIIAHLLVQKYVMGVPFHRLEQKLAFEDFPIDRSTMCRYAEHIGASLGAIVEAARAHAFAHAFCLSTDATGASIQPEPIADGSRQPCRKGHFFVTLADRDHVFFDYQPKHNGLAVWKMFSGFSGYIQADAHAIYDALFRGAPPEGADDDATSRAPPPKEVACWAHSRRKFWEAAVCHHRAGVEGLRRINDIFAADARLADLAPAQRKARRDVDLRPLLDDFFDWVSAEKSKLVSRGLIATALGYAHNHQLAFRRFLDDGRLRLDNNPAENALRSIATARKAWLFFGSDDHASAAANLFSLVASCKLHRLDVEAYLADVVRVMPYWPQSRYLELAPKYWNATRARLDPEELKLPLGHVSVPPPPATEEQSSTG
jgi:transposase